MTSRMPATVASAVGGRRSITIRDARTTDGAALARLEALAERMLGRAPILVAESDGELVAAASVQGGELVADPFRVTLDVTDLLQLRLRQLRDAGAVARPRARAPRRFRLSVAPLARRAGRHAHS